MSYGGKRANLQGFPSPSQLQSRAARKGAERGKVRTQRVHNTAFDCGQEAGQGTAQAPPQPQPTTNPELHPITTHPPPYLSGMDSIAVQKLANSRLRAPEGLRRRGNRWPAAPPPPQPPVPLPSPSPSPSTPKIGALGPGRRLGSRQPCLGGWASSSSNGWAEVAT